MNPVVEPERNISCHRAVREGHHDWPKVMISACDKLSWYETTMPSVIQDT